MKKIPVLGLLIGIVAAGFAMMKRKRQPVHEHTADEDTKPAE